MNRCQPNRLNCAGSFGFKEITGFSQFLNLLFQVWCGSKPPLPGLECLKQGTYGRVHRKIGRKNRKLNSPDSDDETLVIMARGVHLLLFRLTLLYGG